MTVIINGVKCYPTCNWEQNQHKVYNAHDRAYNALYDLLDDDSAEQEAIDKAHEWANKMDTLCSLFNNHIVGNTVYLPYEWYALCKDVVGAYNARH